MEVKEMPEIDYTTLGHEEIRASVHAAALDLFPKCNFSTDCEELPFSELGLDEVDVALFLLKLEDMYQIQFSFLHPLSSFGDVCTQIGAYTAPYKSQRQRIFGKKKISLNRR